jgi:hypothetical protein
MEKENLLTWNEFHKWSVAHHVLSHKMRTLWQCFQKLELLKKKEEKLELWSDGSLNLLGLFDLKDLKNIGIGKTHEQYVMAYEM